MNKLLKQVFLIGLMWWFAGAQAWAQEIAVISTKFGDMEIEFFDKKAPGHVKNFKDLSKKGFYDGTIFHRVIPNFMIQGGDPNTKNADRSEHGLGGPGYNIDAEFNDISHDRGIVSMARAQDPNSAGSQFFIVVKDAHFLDHQYTVFGKVTKGMDVADKIVSQPRDNRDNPWDTISMKVVIKEKGSPVVAKKKKSEVPPVVKEIKDNQPPVIVITSHEVSRGIVPVPAVPETLVAGQVTDDSGIDSVKVNGQAAKVDPSGNFSAEVPLKTGKTKIQIFAKDTHGNTAWKNFWVEAEGVSQDQMVAKKIESPLTDVSAGKYHAVIIGINNYKHLPKLETAIHDAREVDRVLRQHYGFTTTLLVDPGRDAIMGAFNAARKKLATGDNLLVYYAGHGEFDKAVSKAYWLPADARPDNDTKWIIADNITSNIKRSSAKHILVVADSCYSGTLTRKTITNLDTAEKKKNFLNKMFKKSSRTLMASGGNEPVADSGGGGHSVFARAFIDALKKPGVEMFTAEQLFHNHIKESVAGSAEQVPEYNIIKNSGHKGGDFIFLKRN